MKGLCDWMELNNRFNKYLRTLQKANMNKQTRNKPQDSVWEQQPEPL